MNTTPGVTSATRTRDEGVATVRRIVQSGVLALRTVVAAARELAGRAESR